MNMMYVHNRTHGQLYSVSEGKKVNWKNVKFILEKHFILLNEQFLNKFKFILESNLAFS